VKRFIPILAFYFTITYLVSPELTQAQMFSVQPERQTVSYVPDISISVGYSSMSFDYRGLLPGGSGEVGTTFGFNDPLFHIGIGMPGFSAYGLFGRSLGAFNNTYSQVGASIGNEVPLIRSSVFQLGIPIRLATDYILVKNNSIFTAQEFKQNTFGIHAGIEMSTRLTNNIRFLVNGMTGYSYSVSGFGNSGGTATDLVLKNRLYFDNLFRQYGLLIGLDINSRKYDLEDARYNYIAIQQMLSLGVTF
jgi:hypothetical protein